MPNLQLVSLFALFQLLSGAEGFLGQTFPRGPYARTVSLGSSLPQAVLNWALKSPLYEAVLVPQARRTMVKTAEANSVPWVESLNWIKQTGRWDDAALESASSPETIVPPYYRAAFHAYLPSGNTDAAAAEQGNLCWEAAWEQELAGKAVGHRNFPGQGPGAAGEEAFRRSFDACREELGARPPRAGETVVDLGCGTGTSTRRLSSRLPAAGRVIGVDLSPHMLAVGRFLLARGASEAEWVEAVGRQREGRVELLHRDIAHTRLAPESAVRLSYHESAPRMNKDTLRASCVLAPPTRSTRITRHHCIAAPQAVVSLELVCHELPVAAARAAFAEAHRLLRPGGQLWVGEMDFTTAGFRDLRANPLLFSLIRATEPYLDEYADYQASGGLIEDVAAAGFASVKVGAATGRHFALVATKGDGSGGGGGGSGGGGGGGGRVGAVAVVEDLRYDPTTGRHRKDDTHMRTWESK